MGADSPLERRIDVGREVGGEDDDAGKGLQLVQQDVDDRVGLALVRHAHRREPPTGDRIRLIEEQDRILPLGRAEDGLHVLGRLTDPARFELGVAHDQQPLVQRVREGLGTDRLARAGRTGEVECQSESGRMPLGQPPLMEDQIVLPNQRQRVIERAQGGLGQDDVVE